MASFIRKWGNSPALRLPAAVMKEAGLRVEQQVQVRAEAGRIVVEPCAVPEYDLDALLGGITPSNRHDEVDLGESVGREAWP